MATGARGNIATVHLAKKTIPASHDRLAQDHSNLRQEPRHAPARHRLQLSQGSAAWDGSGRAGEQVSRRAGERGRVDGLRFMSTQRTFEVRKSRTAVGEAPLESARHGLGSGTQAKRKATQPWVDEFPPQSNPLDDLDGRLAAARGGDSDSVDRPVSEAFLAFSNKPTTHDTTSVPIPSHRTPTATRVAPTLPAMWRIWKRGSQSRRFRNRPGVFIGTNTRRVDVLGLWLNGRTRGAASFDSE